MNASGITERLVGLARASVGHLPGGLGHINVMVSMLFAGISGSSTADERAIAAVKVRELQDTAFDQLVDEKLSADDSFRIFVTLSNDVLDQLKN